MDKIIYQKLAEKAKEVFALDMIVPEGSYSTMKLCTMMAPAVKAYLKECIKFRERTDYTMEPVTIPYMKAEAFTEVVTIDFWYSPSMDEEVAHYDDNPEHVHFKCSILKGRIFEKLRKFETKVPTECHMRFSASKYRSPSELPLLSYKFYPQSYHKDVAYAIKNCDPEYRTADKIFLDACRHNVVATDGHVMTVQTIVVTDLLKVDDKANLLIPKDTWLEMCKHGGCHNVDIYQDKGGNHFTAVITDDTDHVYTFENLYIFPAYQSVLCREINLDAVMTFTLESMRSLRSAVRSYCKIYGKNVSFQPGIELLTKGGSDAVTAIFYDMETESEVSRVNLQLESPAFDTLAPLFKSEYLVDMPDWDGRIYVPGRDKPVYFGLKYGGLHYLMPRYRESYQPEREWQISVGKMSPFTDAFEIHVNDQSQFTDYEREQESAFLEWKGKPSPKVTPVKSTETTTTKTPSKEKDNITIMSTSNNGAYTLENIEAGKYAVSVASTDEMDRLTIRSIAHYIREQAVIHGNDPDFKLQSQFITAFGKRVIADKKPIPLTEEELTYYMTAALVEDCGVEDIPDYTEDELNGPVYRVPQPAPTPQPAPAPKPEQPKPEQPKQEQPKQEQPKQPTLTQRERPKSFALTGTFPIKRALVQELMEAKGWKYYQNITLETGVLFNAADDRASSKCTRALEYRVPILGVGDMYPIIGVSDSTPESWMAAYQAACAPQPKQEQPKQEQPKQEQPKQEQPKQEQPKQEQPKQEAVKPARKPSDGTIRRMYDNLTLTYQDMVMLFRDVIPGYYGAIFEDAYLLGQYRHVPTIEDSGFPMVCFKTDELEDTISTLINNGKRIVFLDWNDFAPAEPADAEQPTAVEQEAAPSTPAEVAEDEPIKLTRATLRYQDRLIKAVRISMGDDDAALTVCGLSWVNVLLDDNSAPSNERAREVFNSIDAFISDSLIDAEVMDESAIVLATDEFLNIVEQRRAE